VRPRCSAAPLRLCGFSGSIAATFINSTLKQSEIAARFELLRNGDATNTRMNHFHELAQPKRSSALTEKRSL
jgi:hypothetical protein